MIQKIECWLVLGQKFDTLNDAENYECDIYMEWLREMFLLRLNKQLHDTGLQYDFETIMKRVMHYHYKMNFMTIHSNKTVTISIG